MMEVPLRGENPLRGDNPLSLPSQHRALRQPSLALPSILLFHSFTHRFKTLITTVSKKNVSPDVDHADNPLRLPRTFASRV
jgi:hypothetical protein